MLKSYLKLIGAMLIFGSIGVFVNHISLPSGEIVLARTTLGSAFIFLLWLLRRTKNDRGALIRNLPLLMVSGAVLGFGWMFLFEAYHCTSISIATLTYYCAPILVLLTSPLLLKERLTYYKVIGIIGAMIGLFLINGTGTTGADPLRGLVCGLLSAFLYAALMVLNKFIKGISGLEITLVQLISATMVLLPYVLVTHEGAWVLPIGKELAALLILCVVHTGFGCYLYFSAIQELPGQTIALCSYIDPLSALLFSAVFLNERLTILQLFGALLILGGAAFGEFFQTKQL